MIQPKNYTSVLVPITQKDGHLEGKRKIRIVVLSDTHNDTNKLVHNIPEGDILVHCGDFTERNDWFGKEKGEIPETMEQFNQFLAKLPHKHKLVIAGLLVFLGHKFQNTDK